MWAGFTVCIKKKKQFVNLLDVYFSDLHVYHFTVITVFTFIFLIYYTDIKF